MTSNQRVKSAKEKEMEDGRSTSLLDLIEAMYIGKKSCAAPNEPLGGQIVKGSLPRSKGASNLKGLDHS